MPSRRFSDAKEGAVAILTALVAVALVGFAGFATDVGAVYLNARRLQGAADLAAIAAAQNPANAERAARETMRANGWRDAELVVKTGVYTPDPSIRPRQRFRPDAARANAASVEATTTSPLFFARLFVPEGRMAITRRATAAQTRVASFQIGSRLLSLQGGIANQILSGLTGSQVSLQVMDYEALLDADVELFDYVDALRTRARLQGATYGETLSHEIDPPVLLAALGDTTSDARAKAATRKLAQQLERLEARSGLSRLIDLGPYADVDARLSTQSSDVRVNAMDLVFALLEIAGGDRQVRLDLGATVPGAADVSAWLAIGERPNRSPWLTVTDDRDVVVRTAQMRLYLVAEVVGAGPLSNLGALRAPLLVEAASAQAKLKDITCGFDARDRAVTLSAAPGIGSLDLGEIDVAQLDNFKRALSPRPAELLRTPLVRVEGRAHVTIGGEEWQDLRFSATDISRGAVKTVATRDAVRATLASLVRETQLTVRTFGLGLNVSALTGAVLGALSGIAAPLDGLLNGVLDFLGLHLGEADLKVNGVRCGGASLVA